MLHNSKPSNSKTSTLSDNIELVFVEEIKETIIWESVNY